MEVGHCTCGSNYCPSCGGTNSYEKITTTAPPCVSKDQRIAELETELGDQRDQLMGQMAELRRDRDEAEDKLWRVKERIWNGYKYNIIYDIDAILNKESEGE